MSMKIENKIVIVTPYFEDLEASSYLFRELYSKYGNGVYVVAVDDGSIITPLNQSNFFKSGLDGAILKLNRNVGHQHAIAIGLSWILPLIDENHIVIIMDSDGEDDPHQIDALISRLRSFDCDLVVAARRNRSESIWFKMFYKFYRLFFILLTGRLISFGNFMALKPPAVQRLVMMQELALHIPGTVLRSRLKIESCKIDRGSRYAGNSKMNFIALALHGLRGLMIFAEDVLIRVGLACLMLSISLVVGIAIVIVSKISGFAIPGWASIILGIFIVMLMQTGTLALMTLMLTGMLRSSNLHAKIQYEDFLKLVVTK